VDIGLVQWVELFDLKCQWLLLSIVIVLLRLKASPPCSHICNSVLSRKNFLSGCVEVRLNFYVLALSVCRPKVAYNVLQLGEVAVLKHLLSI
jgi:hypothetical protein